MCVTSSRVFNNNSRKINIYIYISRVFAYNIIVSSEWNETRVNDVNGSNLYTATANFVWFVLCYALQGEYMLPVSFIICSGRGCVTFTREIVWRQGT